MWSGEKMFYDAKNVAECLKQQLYHNAGEQLGYDHVGLHNSAFMQFTGLLDKNGKKIFEGDIVEWMPNRNCKVVYNDIEARFELLQYWDTQSNWLPLSNTMSYYKNLKVIGNLFENPNLLK